MKLPKFYLIQSGLSDENKDRVRAALGVAPTTGTFVFNDEDAKLAQDVSDAQVVSLNAPMSIVGQFPAILSVVNDDGGVETLL